MLGGDDALAGPHEIGTELGALPVAEREVGIEGDLPEREQIHRVPRVACPVGVGAREGSDEGLRIGMTIEDEDAHAPTLVLPERAT